MDIMFLQGAGGSGKSSVMKALQELYGDSKKTLVYTQSSSTRASYAKLGIDSETTSLTMDDHTRVKLQIQVMEDWATDIESKIKSIEEENRWADMYDPSPLLIVDRGPFDRMAYWLLTMMECNPGSVDNYNERMAKMMSWVDSLKAWNVCYVEFPFPVPWSVQDGFRTPNELQTMAISLMISQMCHRHYHDAATRSMYLNFSEMCAPDASPKERAEALMGRYFTFLESLYSVKKRRSFFDRLTGR